MLNSTSMAKDITDMDQRFAKPADNLIYAIKRKARDQEGVELTTKEIIKRATQVIKERA